MTKLISLDTSSTLTGYAVFENGEYKNSGVIDLKREKDSTIRVKKMCKQIYKMLDNEHPDIIVIEKLNVSRNMQATRILSKIIGTAYAYSVLHESVFYYEIQASEWRAKLGFQGKNRKREDYKKLSIQYVKDNFGVDVTDDESDAICAGIGYIKLFE